MTSFFFRLPPGVACVRDGSNMALLGPKGKIYLKRPANYIERSGILIFAKALNGAELFSLKQAIYGISLSYVLVLVLQGVGYRVSKLDNKIVLKLGYSHTHSISIPDGVEIECVKSEMHIRSPHLALLNSFAFSLRRLRFPDSYKGCGVLYKNELIRVKEGKKS